MKSEKLSQHFFWLVTILVMSVLVLPTLFKQGMFTDGMLYSTVASNLAGGKGTFWHLYNSETLYPGFYEQPPLYFWILASLYKIFGDSIFVERFYDAFMLFLTAFLIHKNWQTVVSEELKKLSFVPVFFWITIPVVFWAYSNNMLEITVSVFVLSATFFIFKYYFSLSNKQHLLLAGLFLTAGFLTKGFVALFPLAIPFFYYLIFSKFSIKKWIVESILLMLIPLMVTGLIFSFDSSRSGFVTYLTQRVLHSIKEVSTVNSRFYILGRLGMELLPVVGFNVLFYLVRLAYGYKDKIVFNKKVTFLLLIALSASVPLIVTKEQRGFYLVNSMPYYSLTVSLLFVPMWKRIIDYLSAKKTVIKFGISITTVLIVSTIILTAFQTDEYSRDEAIIKDVMKLKPFLRNEKIISVDKATWDRWSFHSYFMRRCGISLDYSNNHRFFLTQKQNPQVDTTLYRKVGINTLYFDLYEKK